MVVDTSKAVSAWTFAGLSTSDIAAILASIYTTLLICEWLWKKFFRRQAIRFGLIKPSRRTDAE